MHARTLPSNSIFPEPNKSAQPETWGTAAGACSRCTAEIAAGTRPASQQCYSFNGGFDGASICQTCSHSWHDHQ